MKNLNVRFWHRAAQAACIDDKQKGRPSTVLYIPCDVVLLLTTFWLEQHNKPATQ